MTEKKDRELTDEEMRAVSGGTILPTRRTPPLRERRAGSTEELVNRGSRGRRRPLEGERGSKET